MANLDNKFTRCEPDDPSRCQSIVTAGQCPFKATPGFNFCPMHTGRGVSEARKSELKMYRLGKWQARVEEFNSHPELKTVRNEVGIMRVLLEEILGKCTDSHELMCNSNKICEVVGKIERLVPLMQKLEDSSGITLDKNAVLQLADVIAAIIGDYVESSDAKAEVADKIITAIVDCRNVKAD